MQSDAEEEYQEIAAEGPGADGGDRRGRRPSEDIRGRSLRRRRPLQADQVLRDDFLVTPRKSIMTGVSATSSS